MAHAFAVPNECHQSSQLAANQELYQNNQLYFWLPTPPIYTITRLCRSNTCYNELYQLRVKQLIGWPFAALSCNVNLCLSVFLPSYDTTFDLQPMAELICDALVGSGLLMSKTQITKLNIQQMDVREIGQVAVALTAAQDL